MYHDSVNRNLRSVTSMEDSGACIEYGHASNGCVKGVEVCGRLTIADEATVVNVRVMLIPLMCCGTLSLTTLIYVMLWCLTVVW